MLLGLPVHKGKLAPQDLQGLPGRKAFRERSDRQVLKALLALRGQLVLLAKLAPPVPLVLKVRRVILVPQDRPDPLVHRVFKDLRGLLAQQGRKVLRDRPVQLEQQVLKVPLGLLAPLGLQGHKAQPALLGRLALLVLLAPPVHRGLRVTREILDQQARLALLQRLLDLLVPSVRQARPAQPQKVAVPTQ